MRFDVDTKASPEQLRRALTDFTGRRPQIWNRTLDPKSYELGDTWAVARESTPGSPFWVVARYDWSEHAMLRWTVVESSYGGRRRRLVRIRSNDHGGSRLQAEWTTTDARISQRPLLFLLHHGPADRLISRMWASALDRYARDDRS